MITEKQLVENNILYNQSSIVSELAYKIENDALYNDDVLEWWLVLPTFARMLKAAGEVILEEFDNYWWGRTTSGQAIYLDSVIAEIVDRLKK